MLPKRRTTPIRRSANRRRLALEPLECRLLLSVTDAEISSWQEQALVDGLNGLVLWADGREEAEGQEAVEGLDEHDLMARLLPVAGQSVGYALDVGDVLQQGLVAPIEDYFDTASTPTTGELVTVLEGLSGTYGNLTVTVDPGGVSGGLSTDAGGSELIFNLVLQAQRCLSTGISLGPEGEARAIAFAPSITIDLDADLSFDFSFGLDLGDGLSPEEAFFIRSSGLHVLARASDAALPLGEMHVGFYEARLTGGSMYLDAALDATLNNPDADDKGNITLEELQDTEMSSLVTLVSSGSSSGSISVGADSFGGFTPGSPLSVSFGPADPFNLPNLSFSTDFHELLNFSNLSSYTVLGLLNQIGTWLDQLRGTSVLGSDLQLADGTTLGDVLELGGMISDPDEGLVADLVDEEDVPTFDGAQSFDTELQAALGLTADIVAAAYNETTNELTYHLVVERTFTPEPSPFGVALDLSPLAGIASSSTVNVAADATLECTLGFDLSGLSLELVATADGPADGQLATGDAHFSLLVGNSGPVAVTVAQSETDNNVSLDDLVGDFNAALATAGIGSAVTASRQGNRLKLSTARQGSFALLALAAEDDDPIVTELHFEDGQLAADTMFLHTFLEDASVSGNAATTASGVDASARIGFLEVDAVDASGSENLAIDFDLTDSETSTPGGRVYLQELYEALAEDLSAVVDTPQLGGSMNLQMPLQATEDVLGPSHPADPEVVVNWPDVTNAGTLEVTFNNAELLLDFRDLEAASFVGAFGQIADYLRGLEAYSFLSEKIPGLDKSIGQITGYADRFTELLSDFEEAPAETLQQLEATMEAAFGLDDSALELSLAEGDTVVRVDLTLQEAFARQLAVDLDLDGLGLGDFGNLVDVSASGQLAAALGVLFNLDFGIDLTDPEDPAPFLYDTSGLAFTAKVAGTDIEFSTALGPLGVWVKNGSLLIDGDGSSATPDDTVVLAVGLQDDGLDPDGKIYLGELSLDHADLTLAGQAHAVLPIYAPTASNYVGDVDLAITDLGDIGHNITLTAPDFESMFGNFDLVNNLGGVIDGIDFVLAGVQGILEDEVFSTDLPIIGDGLADAATFIQDVRTDVIQRLRDRFGESLRDTPSLLKQVLFDALGPEGLDLVMDKDESGSVTVDDIGLAILDTDDNGSEDEVIVDMYLGKELTLVDTPVQFDIGLPALGLAADGNVQLELGLAWHLAFGIGRDYGFYLNTAVADELTVWLRARIPDLRARGNLLFLQLDVADEDADDDPNNAGEDVDSDGVYPSIFQAAVVVDLMDPTGDPEDQGDDDLLTFSDFTSGDWGFGDLIDVYIDGAAGLHLDLLVSYEGDSRFPSLGADFSMNWAFNSSDGLSGSVPTVAFNNVRLNVGDFITDFAESLLKDVQQVTEPLQPIVDFLTDPVPLLSDFGYEVTPLDLAAALGYEEAADFIDTVAGVIDLINSVPVLDDDIYIPLGSFDLSGDTPEEQVDPREEDDLADAEPHVTVSPDVEQELKDASSDGWDFFDGMHDLGISLPIIEDPSNVFRLLLGQDVDLFLFDLPDLSLGFPFPSIKIGPIIPPIPLYVAFSGYIGASLDLKFGYDTHGLRTFLETGDPLDVFSGFFVSDRKNADGTGKDVPEGTLTGAINAGAEISIWVVSAGVSGGVALNLLGDLNDPNGDGKIHVDEFLANLELGLLSTFNVSGEITAKLDAYVEVLLIRYEYTIAEVTLADFELTDSDIYQDRFSGGGGDAGGGAAASLPGGGDPPPATDLGVGPGLHVDGLSLETAGDDDWYVFELLRPDSVDVDVRYHYVHGDVDLEVWNASGAMLGESRTDKDREIVSLLDVPAGKYYVHVIGQGKPNNYMVAVEPGKQSNTRVIYVNPSDKTDRSDSYYTTEPGNDDWPGLLYRKPKASLQSVLDTYDLGPDDLVVLDSGQHEPGAAITADDEGATYVGTPAGSYISGVTLDDSDDSLFHMVGFAGPGIGIHIPGDGAGDATGNVLRYCEFGEVSTGVWVAGDQPNLIEDNTFVGPGDTGIHLAPGTTVTVRHNDVAGFSTGIYCDSKVADVYHNAIHDNAVGFSSRRGVIGPDNPAPMGTAAEKEPNEVFSNETGVLIPDDAAGVLLRFTRIYHNTQVGIEAQGDNSRIIANEVYGNAIGIRGTNAIGPDQWASELHNFIHDNETGVWAQPGAEVRYNRIYANQTGVRVDGETVVHHNLIYRNSGHGVLLDEANDVEVVNNTIFAPDGNGVHLDNACSDITVHNNVVQATSGHALYVAADSQFGYTSDYNNFFTAGSGKVGFQGKAFYDLYDWQVEAESDLHSIGYTTVNAGLDDPKFVNLAGDDYHLSAGSTSIDAGDPASDYSLEPGPNGDRVNLGAYGNTPEAIPSAPAWLEITYPNFYVDLVPGRTYEITWESYNVPGGVDLEIDLIEQSSGTRTDIATVPVSAGRTTWTPGSFVSGAADLRYRIELATVGDPWLVELSREAFAIPDVVPSDPATFYVDDRDDTNDEYTPDARGDNRNTGTTPDDPKVVIRPLVLSYALGSGDTVRVDTGGYVHAVNLNLGGRPLAFDPRMNTVSGTLITGPTDLGKTAQIDRANPFAGSTAVDLIGADNMALENLIIINAETGVRLREGSVNFSGDHVHLSHHTLEGISIEDSSDSAMLDYFLVHDCGRHGIFVDSLLTRITESKVYDNDGIGIALRSVGAPRVETSQVYRNLTGIDVINPGTANAVVGHDDLDALRGNLVHHNETVGIYASGNVLVAGNTVSENGTIGVRLDDGADAVRNVVRQHVTGISARGSTSDILENRSYANTDTGIIASHHSNVLRNVTYSNGACGIDTDRFSGVIDHNLVYESGYASINVEGPAAGAQLVNNTVYEPCPTEEEEEAVLEFAWEWDTRFMRFEPFADEFVLLEGVARIRYGEPVGQTTGGTFDLGPGGGYGALTPEPVPPGDQYEIETELVALELSGVSTTLGSIAVSLSLELPSVGHILVENQEGLLVGSTLMDLNVEFYFPGDGTRVVGREPMHVKTSFDLGSGINELETLRTPLPIQGFGPPPVLVNPAAPPPGDWGQWTLFGGTGRSAPPPQDPGRQCAEFGIIVSEDSSHVLLRNNAVYVGGTDSCTGGVCGYDVVVAADSTFAWDSDFNILTTTEGSIGQWAGTACPTLSNWQTASMDDLFDIDPDVGTIWVDPDGYDNLLGFVSVGASDGRDDNLHLRSPFGQAIWGALAPVEDTESADPSGLPVMLPVVFDYDPMPKEDDLSPGIDWGDPAYDYASEPETPGISTHGQFINVGCYGNKGQTSMSEPEYIHMVYPLGFEELVPGQTYLIQWRSQVQPGTVDVELYHGSHKGALERVIQAGAPNTGSYLWTVPLAGITPGGNYVVAVTWPGDLTDPNDDVVGQSRFGFAVGPDTIPPVINHALPLIVDYQLATNAGVSDVTLEFSENLDPTAAADPNSYELRSAGPSGSFEDGDDTIYPVTPSYSAAPSDDLPSTVVLDISGGPLPEEDYQLKVPAGAIIDPGGNDLDGDADGAAGGDWVRQFTIDMSDPTVSIASVSPNPRNESVDQVSIVFSEAVAGVGLADLRLTRDGGSHLLTGAQTPTTTDQVTWTIPNLDEITDVGGQYRLELAAGGSGIFDLAGNPLAGGASTGWFADMTAPTVEVVQVMPDPRGGGVAAVSLAFSEPVYGFGLSGLSLHHNGGGNLLSASQTPTSTDHLIWTIPNLSGLTAADGIYKLTLTAVDAGIQDAVGNELEKDVLEVWRVDRVSPVAHVVDVDPNSRNTAVYQITIALNESITGLDLSDLVLTRGGGANLLGTSQTLTSLDGMNWRLGGLSDLTGLPGNYVLVLTASGSGIQDLAGNLLLADADGTWGMDLTAPTVALEAVLPDPHRDVVPQMTITFSEPVTGFDLADLVLTFEGGENLLTGEQTLTSSDGATWLLSNLSGLTAASGTYQVPLTAAGSAIRDLAGNPLVAGDVESWLLDAVPPTVEILDVTPDPRQSPVSQIDVVFSEPISGLDLADFLLCLDYGGNLLPATATLSTSDNVTWTLGNLSGLTGAAGEYGLALAAPASGIEDPAGNPLRAGTTEVWIVEPPPAQVLGRYLFYDHSAFDDPRRGLTDGDAIAPGPGDASDPSLGKTALLPGQTATFRNYTSYSRGINGMIIDIEDLHGTPDASTFDFKIGNDDNPLGWTDAPQPASVTWWPDAGVGGSDRITITWEDHDIENTWLQVTVKAQQTGLEENDVFYFGNVPGEAGDSGGNTIVNTTDEILARGHPHGPRNPAAIDDAYDYNRDGLVNATDRIIARNNRTGAGNALLLITAPGGGGGSAATARDAALQGIAQRESAQRTTPLGKLAWLCDFEQLRTRRPSRKANPTARAVDQLLASYGL